MFNRSPFNRMPFNRSFTFEVLFSATLEGESSLSASSVVEYLATATLLGDASLSAAALREIIGVLSNLSGEGNMTAASVRERLNSAMLAGEGSLNGNGGRYHVDQLVISGPFAPGEKIIVDSHKLRVTKNGVMTGYNGDFFDLSPGTNNLVYQDTASGRSIQMRITYRDKFV